MRRAAPAGTSWAPSTITLKRAGAGLLLRADYRLSTVIGMSKLARLKPEFPSAGNYIFIAVLLAGGAATATVAQFAGVQLVPAPELLVTSMWALALAMCFFGAVTAIGGRPGGDHE